MSTVRITKAVHETRKEIERLGGVWLGVEPTGKRLKISFSIYGTEQFEMISTGTNTRYDPANLRRKLRQRFRGGPDASHSESDEEPTG